MEVRYILNKISPVRIPFKPYVAFDGFLNVNLHRPGITVPVHSEASIGPYGFTLGPIEPC